MRTAIVFGLLWAATLAVPQKPNRSKSNVQAVGSAADQARASCECDKETQSLTCSPSLSPADKCACTNKAMRACSQRCGKPFDWSLVCRVDDARKLRSRVTAEAQAEAQSLEPREAEAAAEASIKQGFEISGGGSDRDRPATVQCGGPRRLGCPANQLCSVDINSRELGVCTGAPCFLAGRGGFTQLCPADTRSTYRQVCVQQPREDLAGGSITDAPGLCADPKMKCGGRYPGCPGGWVCQSQPNGDGDPCRGDSSCEGLCIHYGDRSERKLRFG